MDDRTALSRRLTEIVSEVDGVKAVYSSAPIVVATLAAVTQAVGQTFTPNTPVLLPEGAAPVRSASGAVVDAPGGEAAGAFAEPGVRPGQVAVRGELDDTVVSVTIGVDVGMSATQVCRTVYDVIAEHFVRSGAPVPRSISVKVGRIG